MATNGTIAVGTSKNIKQIGRMDLPGGGSIVVENGYADAGLKVFDISDRAKPREIAFFKAPGKGLHRFTADERYAYLSPTMDGYVGNIAMIVDLKNPSRPEEVGRWWMPGQWTAGGETPTWHNTDHRCHHPIRRGNRLYISYWHGGFAIVDILDISKTKTISTLDWSPPYPFPTHTTLPFANKIMDR